MWLLPSFLRGLGGVGGLATRSSSLIRVSNCGDSHIGRSLLLEGYSRPLPDSSFSAPKNEFEFAEQTLRRRPACGVDGVAPARGTP